jgi:hypothetical protein
MNLRETINQLIESTKILGEDYPQSFNMKHFKSLTSFKDKIAYCEQHLQRLGSGSSRIVYLIDNERVLKLAKNAKGLAQNAVEIRNADDNMLTGLVPEVYEVDENDQWFETQLAEKMSKGKFQQLIGVSWDIYAKLLHNYATESTSFRATKYKVPQDIDDESWDNEFIRSMYDYVGNFQNFNHDLLRMSSYGAVKDNVVLIDSGLNKEVYAKHYS